MLYQVLSRNLEAFRQGVFARGKTLPAYVERELEAFLECGMLEHGFTRLKCVDCDEERLLPFSCKRRGFCPSCCGRRMTETEMRLVDDVFPHETARQWVLSLPIPLRFLCARDRPLVNNLARIFCRTVEQTIRRKLCRRGVYRSRSGGVLFIQRLGGALNLNVHFHAIFLDGAYETTSNGSSPVFHDLADNLSSADIARTVQMLSAKAVRMLKAGGYLGESLSDEKTGDALALCDEASVGNRVAFGDRAGQRVRRLRLPQKDGKPRLVGELIAEMNGFNLKADKVVKAHQRWKLARLIRYVARPPVATERLFLREDGNGVRYVMKRPWPDGTSEILLSGVELVEKLAAAVPPPRGHLVRYFGVLAPNAALRRLIVPCPKPKARDRDGRLRTTATQRVAWAALAKYSFGIDLSQCEFCGGKVRRIAVIRNPVAIAKVLAHLGLEQARCDSENARAPPEYWTGFDQLPAYSSVQSGGAIGSFCILD